MIAKALLNLKESQNFPQQILTFLIWSEIGLSWKENLHLSIKILNYVPQYKTIYDEMAKRKCVQLHTLHSSYDATNIVI